MVPPGEILLSILVLTPVAVRATADPLQFCNFESYGMPLSSAESALSAHSESSDPWPPYPSENPSTEAEIIAASAASVEIVYVRTLLRELGLEQQRPTTLRVDNSGAVELSRDRKSCHRSRHVDRRFFKVRELSAAGVLSVQHVPTELNRADFLTKPLDETTFLRHRAAAMNTPRE